MLKFKEKCFYSREKDLSDKAHESNGRFMFSLSGDLAGKSISK